MKVIFFIITLLLISSCGAPLLNDQSYRIELPSQSQYKKNNTPSSMSMPVLTAGTQNKTVISEIPGKIIKKDGIENQLSTASLTFSVPEYANVSDTITAQLLINPNLSPEELAKQLKINSPKEKTEIQISKIVITKLIAPDFIVEKVTPEEQIISETKTTEWLWRLKPKATGKYVINLSVTAVIKVSNQKMAEHHIKTFDRDVTVTIKSSQIFSNFLEKYWQWILSTIIIPFGLWIYKSKFSKSKD